MDTTQHGLSRFRAILQSPSLALHRGTVSPLGERALLRRLGLSRAESRDFLAALCEHGLYEEGCSSVLLRAGPPDAAAQTARALLAGAVWPAPLGSDSDSDSVSGE